MKIAVTCTWNLKT